MALLKLELQEANLLLRLVTTELAATRQAFQSANENDPHGEAVLQAQIKWLEHIRNKLNRCT